MTADQILAARHYSQIFKSRERLKQDYINLCKVYHPDLHSNNEMASEIMSKINVLYEQAQKTHDLITFKGKELIPLYQTKRLTICEAGVLIQPANMDRYLDHIKFSYTSERMEKEFSRYFPRNVMREGDLLLLEIPNLYSFREIQERGSMDPVHLAWLMNRLFNIAMYLDHYHLMHGGLTLDNLLFDPASHTVYLLGGWEHLTKYGQAMKSIDREVYDLLSYSSKYGNKADPKADLASILLIGQKLLSDEKHPFHSFLAESHVSVLDAYQKWGHLLETQFGKRRFVEYAFWR